jgi:solute carrier family 35 protein E1
MPIFTVILSKLFLNQTHSKLAYLSLVPIMGGVIICSVTELEFNLVGLLSALFSTFIFAVQNIYSKKVGALSTLP